LSVDSQNLAGNAITGYWTVLYNQKGGTVSSGYTPATYTLNNGQTYTVEADSYGSCQFDYWKDTGNANPLRTISITGNTAITAVYDCGTGTAASSVTIKSVDQNGNTLTGYWTVLYGAHGRQLSTGYTPTTFGGLTSGAVYSVELDSYANCQFSHWQDNGNATDTRSFTAKGAQTFVGVYTCSVATATTTALDSGGAPLAPGDSVLSGILLVSLAVAAFSATVVTAKTARKTGTTP
jgi:hypothetical protein